MIAIGLVLTAVFVPCAFISGIVGQFFRQFALTIAVSTIISAFNSLTLSPALAALLLKPQDGRRTHDAALPRVGLRVGAAAGSASACLAPIAGDRRARRARPRPWRRRARPRPRWSSDARPSAGRSVGRGRRLDPRLAVDRAPASGVLPALQRRASRWRPASTRGSSAALLRVSVARAPRLRRAALPDLLGVHRHARPGSSRRRTWATCWSTSSCPTRPRRADPGGDEQGRARSPRRSPASSTRQTIAGQSLLLSANGSNFGSMFLILDSVREPRSTGAACRRACESRAVATSEKSGLDRRARLQTKKRPRSRRSPGRSTSGDAIQGCSASRSVPEAMITVLGPPPVRGVGRAGGFKLMVEDRGDIGPQRSSRGRPRTSSARRRSDVRPSLQAGRLEPGPPARRPGSDEASGSPRGSS